MTIRPKESSSSTLHPTYVYPTKLKCAGPWLRQNTASGASTGAASDACVESCCRCYRYNSCAVGGIGGALYTSSCGSNLLETGQRYPRRQPSGSKNLCTCRGSSYSHFICSLCHIHRIHELQIFGGADHYCIYAESTTTGKTASKA